jgi:hypothetical protein
MGPREGLNETRGRRGRGEASRAINIKRHPLGTLKQPLGWARRVFEK